MISHIWIRNMQTLPRRSCPQPRLEVSLFRYFPTDLRETAVYISTIFKPEDNCLYCEVNERQQSQIFKVLKEIGSVVLPKEGNWPWKGRPGIWSFGNPAWVVTSGASELWAPAFVGADLVIQEDTGFFEDWPLALPLAGMIGREAK